MRRYSNIILALKVSFLLILIACQSPDAQTVNLIDEPVQLDRSKPVPARADVIAAFQKRQDAVRSAHFEWTEQQTHPKGWIPNPRLPEREFLEIPNLLSDRSYTITKSLIVDGAKMRYSYQLERKPEPDGIRIPLADGQTAGFGEGKHYVYASTFDGQAGRISLRTLLDSPPPVVRQVTYSVDAQNLDTRAIMMAIRPLDPVMGHLLVDRAVTNGSRTIYKGRSIFLLEEQRDPSGWKTILWVEPERGFLISRYSVFFEQKRMVDIEIDHKEDANAGWVPTGWRVTQRTSDGSMKLVSDAKVTRYAINQPIDAKEFRE